MFKCDNCKRVIGPNIKQEHHVVQTRPGVYVNTTEESSFKTQGTEIVKTIAVCPICHANMTDQRFDSKKYWIGPKTIMPTMYTDDITLPEKTVDNRRHLADE